MLSRSLTSIKQLTKLSSYYSHEHNIHEHDSLGGQTGIQQEGLPTLAGITTLIPHSHAAICFIASYFTSCVSLYPPQTHMLIPPPQKIKRTFLSNEMSGFSSFEIAPLPWGCKPTGFIFKVSFPLVEFSSHQPNCAILPSCQHTYSQPTLSVEIQGWEIPEALPPIASRG